MIKLPSPRNRAVCSMDPLSAFVSLIAGGIGSMFGGGKSDAAPVVAPEAPPPAPPTQSPVGQKPQAAQATPSFIGASAVPQQQNMGGKSLLGQ